MAVVSRTQCFCAVLLTVILTWLPGEAVYFESAYSQKQERPTGQRTSSTERQRRGRGRERNTEEETEEESLPGRSENRRRDPFHRTLVLCYTDDECDRKHFCHGGEGHKSCVPCRKSRKRCHRNDMCCEGYTCQDGRCRVTGARVESIADQGEDVRSYNEAEDSFWNRDVPRRKQRGEACEGAKDCQEGLCCARHLWSRVCLPMLEEGDLCTKKRDRISDLFQRCDCSAGLSCKRVPNVNTRLHACFPVKTHTASHVVTLPDDEPTDERETLDDAIMNEVPIPSSSSTKRKRQSNNPIPGDEEEKMVLLPEETSTSRNRTDAKESSQEKNHMALS